MVSYYCNTHSDTLLRKAGVDVITISGSDVGRRHGASVPALTSQACLSNARSLDFEALFCADRFLVSADDRAFNKELIKVGLARGSIENALNHIGFSLTAKPPDDGVPSAETPAAGRAVDCQP